jgi:hypothetical protein
MLSDEPNLSAAKTLRPLINGVRARTAKVEPTLWVNGQLDMTNKFLEERAYLTCPHFLYQTKLEFSAKS